MVNELPAINLKPIGIVRNELKQPVRRDCREIISEIVIDPGLSEALDDLDEFSHIVVLYWMHRQRDLPMTKVHPMGNRQIPLKGVFATRSPRRPNPIGQTTVRLLQRQGNTIRVEGLDAISGTPVIDIKPCIPDADLLANARVPRWIAHR